MSARSFNRPMTIAALDVGSSKVCCVIAKVNRDKRIKVVGYGYNVSEGIKNGIVTDFSQATLAVCNAVEAAEQMANERIDKVVVNIAGDKIKSIIKKATINLNKHRPVNDIDLAKLNAKGRSQINVDGYIPLHRFLINYSLDGGEEIKDPRNIFGEKLSADILSAMVPDTVYKNVETVLENSRLDIYGKVFSAYASGLSCLVDDEREIGATVIDMGGGTTSMACFKHGFPVYFASLPVGGTNVTNDIAFGLTTSFSHAEKLKALYGCAFLSSQDKEETIDVYPVGEEDDSNIKQIPRADLIKIITPRIEETFEMVNHKLAEAGLKNITSHRVVLTGGASQLTGVREIASMVLDKQVRLGGPQNILNLPDNLYSPVYSTCIGMILFEMNDNNRKSIKVSSKSIGGVFGTLNKLFSFWK